jgi:hypothetical protein
MPIVEGLREGDSVYLNGNELELVHIQMASPDSVEVVAYSPDGGLSIAGDWQRLRDELDVKHPTEYHD